MPGVAVVQLTGRTAICRRVESCVVTADKPPEPPAQICESNREF